MSQRPQAARHGGSMAEMRLGPTIKGLLTFVPGISEYLPSKNVGHTDSATYCYSVWLKHLTLLRAHGLQTIPETVAELGPGESIGVGIAALLAGVDHYMGLDVVAHSKPVTNLRILDELARIYADRTPRPDKGWPDFDSYLDERLFPSHILTSEVLQRSLADDRLQAIRDAIRGTPTSSKVSAVYRAPWSDPRVIIDDSVDLAISHSVLEHVVDLPGTYRALHRWLKPGGWMSHQIDLRAHGLTKRWNGFRACSEPLWKMTLGRRSYMLNRHPASVHLRLIEEAGFKIVTQLKAHRTDGISRDELAARWADISEDDLTCSGMYVIARK